MSQSNGRVGFQPEKIRKAYGSKNKAKQILRSYHIDFTKMDSNLLVLCGDQGIYIFNICIDFTLVHGLPFENYTVNHALLR